MSLLSHLSSMFKKPVAVVVVSQPQRVPTGSASVSPFPPAPASQPQCAKDKNDSANSVKEIVRQYGKDLIVLGD